MAVDHAIQAADMAGRQRQRTTTAAAPAPTQAEPLTLDHRGHLIEKWEYDVITNETAFTRNRLDELGRKGWCLTAVLGNKWFFRRRVQITARPAT
jgi:hypothetical protein